MTFIRIQYDLYNVLAVLIVSVQNLMSSVKYTIDMTW